MSRLNPYTTYLIISVVSPLMFSIAFTTSAIYRFEMAGLDPLQLVLLGTALEGSIFLFEIPTGIVADLFSRRLSVIIGYALIGGGFLLEGSLPLFATILLAQALWGVGYTFISGAQDAWLADELGEQRLPAIYLRGSQFARVAGFIGIGINVALASVALNLPFLVAGVGQLGLALFLVLFMPETGFQPIPKAEREGWRDVATTFRKGLDHIQQRPLLKTILGITLVYGLYSEALDRLWQAHLLDNFSLPALGNLDQVVWFGLIEAVLVVITLGTTEFIRRRAGSLDHRRTVGVLAAFSGTMALGLVVFGLSQSFVVALLAFGTVAVARSTMSPIYDAWVNKGIEPRVRATVLSTVGQMDAIGQTVGGPVMGVIANNMGLRAAFVASGLILAPVLGLYGRAGGQDPETKPVSAPGQA